MSGSRTRRAAGPCLASRSDRHAELDRKIQRPQPQHGQVGRVPGRPGPAEQLPRGHDLRNAVALSGDVHLHYAAEFKDSYDDPASATLGVEFTNTSISWNGDSSEVAEAWDGMKADNPHIKYHSARRGYVSFEVTPARGMPGSWSSIR